MAPNPRVALAGVVVVAVVGGLAVGASSFLSGGPGPPSDAGPASPSPTTTAGQQTTGPTPTAGAPTASPTTSTETRTPATRTPTPEPTPTPTPTPVDSDEDGLTYIREAELGTDPTSADTDGDGLDDAREVELGTSPLTADTDADGLEDGRELEVGTDPLVADTDGDNLDDGRELEVGTDPTEIDTDDDQLLDGWEVRGRIPGRGTPLPNASATRMDIYARVAYGTFTQTLTDRDLNIIEQEFRRMDVANPDGSTGITLHLGDNPPHGGILNRSINVTGPGASFESLREALYTDELLGNRTGVYHLVVVGHVDPADGYAEAPGLFSVVDERVALERRDKLPGDRAIVVHELLHNVVGDFTVANGTQESPADRPGYHYETAGFLRSHAGNFSAPWAPYLGFATQRELAVKGLKAPAGDGFPPAGRSPYGGDVVAADGATGSDGLAARVRAATRGAVDERFVRATSRRATH
jgi:hypothetical protein